MDVIRTESIRQPQRVMSQYVELRPGCFWSAPNSIYGGSIVKLYGFSDIVIVTYGRYLRDDGEMEYLISRCADHLRYITPYRSSRSSFNRYEYRMDQEELQNIKNELENCFRGRARFDIAIPSSDGHTEIAIIGESGRRLPWGLISLSRREDGGKVYVESTPRIRSEDWSWVEEVKDSFERVKKISPSMKIKSTVNGLNIRKRPNRNSQIIGKAKIGKIFIVKSREGPWVQIENDSQALGWLHGGYVEVVLD